MVIYQCLRSYTPWDTQDSLGFLCQRLHGWFSIRGDCVDYFVPQDRSYMLYLLDPNLKHNHHLDYIQ